MLKTPCLILLLLFSFEVRAQTDTLSTLGNLNRTDSTKSITVKHHFLWWLSYTIYYKDVKNHKMIQRRRFLRNMLKRNRFDRLSNMKVKVWDDNGRLISRITIKPYTSEGKRREVKYVYYPNGKLRSKSVKVRKGRLGLRRERLKEYDENGKRVRQFS